MGGGVRSNAAIVHDAGVAEAIQHWSGLGVAIIFFLYR